MNITGTYEVDGKELKGRVCLCVKRGSLFCGDTWISRLHLQYKAGGLSIYSLKTFGAEYVLRLYKFKVEIFKTL